MAAGGQVHAHEAVPRLHHGHERGLVGLGAGVRLNIGEAGVKQRLHPLDRQALHHINKLATAVVATTGIALGVFVGQHGALSLQHRAGDDVLRRDQFDLVALATQFLLDGVEDR